uniref:serine protease 42 n=1 Tax=Jaculus jaculus TaxID=51337 RepID=UPI001E1B2F3C|nr:serine protease 42 [Jaculus jaculus]
MASWACGSLRLLAWLLLLQPPGARASSAVSSSPRPSGARGEAGATSPAAHTTTESTMPPLLPFTSGTLAAPGRCQAWSRAPLAPVGDAMLPGDELCGHPIMKIVGGIDTEQEKWPWQVSVRVRQEHVCGGSLIAAQWVMTAAHCIFIRFRYNVKLGDRSIHTTKTSLVVPIQKIFVHPLYSTDFTMQADVALLKLLYPVNFSSTIHPVCVPSETFKVKAGISCWVTGWGKTGKHGSVTAILQAVEQNLIFHEECNKMLQEIMASSRTLVLKGMICAYKGLGKDACAGDSGGPLSCEINKTWVQVGIVSWGIGCGLEGYPGVYVDTSFHSKWLIAVLNQATSVNPVATFILFLCLLTS